jgi:hypothetical protein
MACTYARIAVMPAAAQRSMARRARARTVEIPRASQGYCIRKPNVVELVRAAAHETTK